MKQPLTIMGETPELNARYRMHMGLTCKLVFIDNNNSSLPFKVEFQFPDSAKTETYWLSNDGIDGMGLSSHTLVEKLEG